MVNHAFSVHAHFYQPPREDPLTGIVPQEAGSAPFPNWNERIHAECYRPNAELRNFESISFNVGPTLFRWMEGHDPATCGNIVAQDTSNVRRYGVGNAIAQAYNHTILPLACTRDKNTQVAWGIADFEHRFGRRPQGMWLPETAVDYETLELMANQGISFTILAPWQAGDQEVDVTEPYRIPLGGGREITVFFYQRELSARVSFDSGATINADTFARYILPHHFSAEKSRRGEPQFVVIASDGELYGHHQYQRDRFLARLVDGAASSIGLLPTYPALWLQQHPARATTGIRELTSWSCHHGVTRWTGRCPCTPGDGAWKALLRATLDRLASDLDGLYLEAARPWVADPWELRDRYIQVILGKTTAEALIIALAGRALPGKTVSRLQLLLESQRERQRMFTSCGWFFEDFDRIEPKNNVAYAAQAVRLARLATGVDLAPSVVAGLNYVFALNGRLSASSVFLRHLDRAEENG